MRSSPLAKLDHTVLCILRFWDFFTAYIENIAKKYERSNWKFINELIAVRVCAIIWQGAIKNCVICLVTVINVSYLNMTLREEKRDMVYDHFFSYRVISKIYYICIYASAIPKWKHTYFMQTVANAIEIVLYIYIYI